MSGRRVKIAVASVVSVLTAVGAVVVPSLAPVGAAEFPTVSMGDASGLERDLVTGSVFVPVFLSDPAVEPVTVSFFTVQGSASEGLDYVRWGSPGSPRSVTIPAGALQTTVNVPVLVDADVEGDETFSVQVASVSGGSAVLGDGTGTATIVDADGASGSNPAIAVSAGTVVEGDAGERRAQFFVHLSRPPATNVTITYASADGSGVAPGDYTSKLPGTVTFAPGQISKTIDVLVGSNTLGQADRSFDLEVTVTGGSPVEELSMTGVSTIVDDDGGAPTSCAPGTFSESGNQPCSPAPAGFFVDTAGATAATPCAPGSFQPAAGSTSCQLAPIGSYVEFAGSISATPCPEGTTTLATGSASAEDCVPVAVGPAATDIDAGANHSCAVLADGTARCWGADYSGALGDGVSGGNSTVPVVVAGLSDVVSIAAGGDFSCAALADGAAYCWGDNGYGQLGNGTTTDAFAPVPVTGITDAVSVSATSAHVCARRANGTVSCWGRNIAGQLGDGSTIDSAVPVTVVGISTAIAVTAGGGHSCAVLADGTVRCWGSNSQGQLGNATNTSSSLPVTVSTLSTAADVDGGTWHTCALLADGALRCWGINGGGQLGNGSTGNSNVPVAVAGLAPATSVALGSSHTCAVLADGGARCWGSNNGGTLGDGTMTNSLSPVSPVGLVPPGVARMAASGVHSCAVLTDGGIRCWGNNASGRLGDGTLVNSESPVAVVGIP